MRKIVLLTLASLYVALVFAGLIGLSRAMGSARWHSSDATRSPSECLNPYILRQMDKYPPDGGFRAMPEELVNFTMGTTKDLFYQGQRVVRGDEQRRSYCIGLVFEVYMSACEDWAREHSGSPRFTLRGVELGSSFRDFRRDFYGVSGEERTFVQALVSRGLGQELTDLDDARPGDLVQMWRNGGTGHAAVFLGWEYDEADRRIALHHWSMWRGTIRRGVEYIGRGYGQLNEERIFIVRPYAPSG